MSALVVCRNGYEPIRETYPLDLLITNQTTGVEIPLSVTATNSNWPVAEEPAVPAADLKKAKRAAWTREAIQLASRLLRVPAVPDYEPPVLEPRVARAVGLDSAWRVRL